MASTRCGYVYVMIFHQDILLIWMKGYCHPIREADMRARGVIPADLLAKIPDVSGAVFPSLDQISVSKELIVKNWDSVVGANIQAAP